MNEPWKEPAWEVKVLSDCLYCHKDYKPNLANHYCDDCVMFCPECKTLKGLWCFDFDYTTQTFLAWKAKNCFGILPKDGHKKICGQCLQANENDPVKRLQRSLAKLKPGQLELMLQSQKKEKV